MKKSAESSLVDTYKQGQQWPRRGRCLYVPIYETWQLLYIVYHEEVPYFEWSNEKNEWLRVHRKISFEWCVQAIIDGRVLDVIQNKAPRTHQKKLIVEINEYAYVVPYVEEKERIFFKTMYASRKDTERYLKKKTDNL